MTDIKHRRTRAVLFTSEKPTVRETVVEAVAAGAYLAGADLTGADLTRAKVTAAQRDTIVHQLGLIIVDETTSEVSQ